MSNTFLPQPDQPEETGQSEQPTAPVNPSATFPTVPQPQFQSQFQAPQNATPAQPVTPPVVPPTVPMSAPAPNRATTFAVTNVYAVLSIVFAFISPIPAVIFGHMGLGQIKRNGDAGRGLALAGTIIGYVALVSWIVLGFVYMSMMFMLFGFIDMMFSDMMGYGYDSYAF